MKLRPTTAFLSTLLLLLLAPGAPTQGPALANREPGLEMPGRALTRDIAGELRVPPQPETTTAWMIERADAPKGAVLGHRSLVLDHAGHPHIAYCGDFVYYAWQDGASWHRETVDDAARVGRATARWAWMRPAGPTSATWTKKSGL